MSTTESFPAIVLGPGITPADVADKISDLVLKRPIQPMWMAAMGLATVICFMFVASIAYLFYDGIGLWGVNIPIAWGFAISNYVFWIAIAMGGTFISAGLLLTRQHWRTSVNRFAETMTLLAALNAGIYPLLHLGSPWLFYYLVPYPNKLDLWPNFRSPLIWDVFAVSLYLSVSVALWYVGMIPDLAMLRDRATKRPAKILFGIFALGWRGSSHHWKRYQVTYVLLAALTIPVVFAVHSVTSAVFATTINPWWNESIFPIYFVSGAIFSGVAMAVVLAIPMRRIYGLRDFITDAHINAAGKLILASGLIVAYTYLSEVWMSWYSGDLFDFFQTKVYFFGSYSWTWWMAVFCNGIVPQLLWFPRIRRNSKMMMLICINIILGMWVERYMILVPVLQRNHMPTMWGFYAPTIFDWSIFVGTIGFFMFGFLLFVQFLPMMSTAELMELSHTTNHGHRPPQEFSPSHAE